MVSYNVTNKTWNFIGYNTLENRGETSLPPLQFLIIVDEKPTANVPHVTIERLATTYQLIHATVCVREIVTNCGSFFFPYQRNGGIFIKMQLLNFVTIKKLQDIEFNSARGNQQTLTDHAESPFFPLSYKAVLNIWSLPK